MPADRADDYGSRWDALKGDFVDEPRRAVRQADELVGELLDELQRLFADQRRDLEQGFDHDRRFDRGPAAGSAPLPQLLRPAAVLLTR